MSSSRGYVPPHLRAASLGSSDKKMSHSDPTITVNATTDKKICTSLGSDADLERRRHRFQGPRPPMGYGLLSRGEDNRLQKDPEARREYFESIRDEFAQSFADMDQHTLTASIRNLGIKENNSKSSMLDPSESLLDDKLSKVLMSLRKLREALLNTDPDELTKNVFLFSIRVSSRFGLYQTYIPSIVYLLKHKHVLSKSELREVANLYILHTSHFNNDDQLALMLFYEHARADIRLQQVLTAWRQHDYVRWFELYHTEGDNSRHRVMSFGEPKMLEFATSCIQRSYFQLPRTYVEHLFHMDVAELREKHVCSWTVKEETVIIRVRK